MHQKVEEPGKEEGEERVGVGRVRGATVVGLSDVGARCAASGLQGGGSAV